MFIGCKEKSQRLVTTAGKEFLKRFLAAKRGAVRVRSKEPAAAWNDMNAVGYMSIVEYQSCEAHVPGLGGTPTLAQILVNCHPPGGLYHSLGIRSFRHSIAVPDDATLVERPILEFVIDHRELPTFAEWLVAWENGMCTGARHAPRPPKPLAGLDTTYDFTGDDGRWRFYDTLYTRSASIQIDRWWNGYTAD